MNKSPQILITGATDGLGRELARLYSSQGATVFALGRRPFADLSTMPFERNTYIQADLAQPNAAEIVRDFFEERGIDQLDLVIHNAGMGYHGATAEQSPDNIDALLTVNLWTPIALTHALLPLLRRANGKLLFVSSVVAGLPAPDYAVYSATKAGLDGFARALRVELAGEVAVQIVRPGAIQTGMHAKMGLTTAEMDWRKFPTAEDVAKKVVSAEASSRHTRTIGFGNGVLYQAGRLLSGPLDFFMRRSHSAPSLPSSTNGPWLVTGAADGIGRALTQLLSERGQRVVGVDNDETRARAVSAETGVSFAIADLTTAEGWLAATEPLSSGDPAQVVVHNAGISCAGRFAESSLRRQQLVFDLNLRAPLHMTARLLRDGGISAEGTFVFMSSLSRYTGYPGAAVYAATKDALAAYARGLRVALGPQMNVLTVYPGPTRTAHARRYSPDNSRESRRMPPEKLADAIVSAVGKRHRTLIPGGGNKLFALVGTLLPSVMDRAMQATILDKMDEAHV